MAYNEIDVTNPGVVRYYIAPVGTARAVDPLNPTAVWVDIGASNPEELLNTETDGGDVSTIAVAQNRNLRSYYTEVIEKFNVSLAQWNRDTYRLFYGVNSVTLSNGDLAAASLPVPYTAAVMIVLIEGARSVTFYMPKAELFRADGVTISDATSAAILPVTIKALRAGSNTWAVSISPVTVAYIAPTGATAGAPGSFTPAGSEAPATLADLISKAPTASPATAWAAGTQYVVLLDGSKARWSSSAWVASP